MDRIPTEQYGSRVLKALHVQTRTYKHDFLPSIAPVTRKKNYKMNNVICIENRFRATTSIIDNLHLECDLALFSSQDICSSRETCFRHKEIWILNDVDITRN